MAGYILDISLLFICPPTLERQSLLMEVWGSNQIVLSTWIQKEVA